MSTISHERVLFGTITYHRRRVRLRTREEFEDMKTLRLMGIRTSMLRLESVPIPEDMYGGEIALTRVAPSLFYKDDPRWQLQYDALLAVLNTREHVVTCKKERKKLRQLKAKQRRY